MFGTIQNLAQVSMSYTLGFFKDFLMRNEFHLQYVLTTKGEGRRP